MLEFEGLCAGYDRVEKLHGVNAAIKSGTLTAIIGPNGCGKSTLLKCAAGILRASAGQVCLNRRAIADMPAKQRAQHISYMPQSRLTPDISVRQLVTYGRYPYMRLGQKLKNADLRIIDTALERTKLAAYASRPVKQLSGGERQRVYLAMMLAQQAAVMLLDEPTTYLDLSAQFELMAFLRELCAEGRSAVAVLHDLALALEYSDHIILLQGGRVIADGAPEAVYMSGRIQRVFNIDIDRLEGGKYVFSQREKEI